LAAIEGILSHFKHLKVIVPTLNKRLREAVINSWVKLQEYYKLINNSHFIYAAATFFHSSLRMKYFIYAWIGETAN
jgi:hypothetical protein